MSKLICPNCGSPVANHPQNGCVLNALIRVIRDRGTVTESRLRKIHAAVNVDYLWDKVGNLIDQIEWGEFSRHE